eukprot:TRINITY_DN4614_c0_g1_i2.p1 TRINITY_DN4614_c0_g1~~TRINITY_DN4614_c0_g1_i2.p1  ORF type:complete len:782 (+),score=59.00 TRINITY_DN4614_c0_g1_i2:309-2348(+)
MAAAAREAGANVLMSHLEVFDGAGSPPGFASVVLLDESHLSAHCYTEDGLLAIDAFTCGQNPSSTSRIAERITETVRELFPLAKIKLGNMDRFEHFDVPRYLSEYYGTEADGQLKSDNQALLQFFHRAYERIHEAHAKERPLRVLEVGGGPTLYQLLSASRYSDDITFTDLLSSNVQFAQDSCTGKEACFDWTPYANYVAELEDNMSGAPLQRLHRAIKDFRTLDIGHGRQESNGGVFDVISACFVFEASTPSSDVQIWKTHLRNVLQQMDTDGHLVMTVLLSESGQVVEGGKVLPTPIFTEQVLRDGLTELGFTKIQLELIDTEGDEGGSPMKCAALTARRSVPNSNPHKDHDHHDFGAVAKFARHYFRHFNSAALVEAADGYRSHIDKGGKMLVTLAGAMSTAEIGVSLAQMIRSGKVHALSVTGANLEEDFFNLLAHKSYSRIPDWRGLSKADEQNLFDRGMNRVTDTCIPEEKAVRRCEKALLELYCEACEAGERLSPHELFYRLILRGTLSHFYEIDPNDSWLVAAAEAQLPIVCPGWEDSTCGNMIVANKVADKIPCYPIKSGLEQMEHLIAWYNDSQASADVGFFQVGGGIAGDYPVCAVPLIRQDLERDVKLWSYFCQISDGTTSYGGYSAAPPNEKITWGKLAPGTPSFIVESDATIVWPLVCAIVLADR